MKIKSLHLGILVIVFIFGGIAATSATNMWQTTNAKVAATIKTGEFAGQANPADIKGSYTFADVNKNFNVPVQDLAKAFALDDVKDPAAFKNKDLEARYAELAKSGKEIGTGSVRMFVAYYLGLPYDPGENTWLPVPAAEILKQRGKMTPAQAKYVEEHTVQIKK